MHAHQRQVNPHMCLKAMCLSDAKAHSSIRFRFGRFSTMQEITIAIEEIKKVYFVCLD